LWPFAVSLQTANRRVRSVVLVPDGEALREVEAWLAVLQPAHRVAALPAWDVAPLDHALPDPRIVARRALAAERLAADDWDVLVMEATATAVPLRRYPAPAAWDLLEQAEFEAAGLLERGYQRVREVSAPGEFAVRGEVIDLWSPLEEFPLRVERFDVLIEAMRRFDPVSQLGARPVERYRVGYVATPPLTPEQEAELVERIRQRASRRHADPVQMERVLDALAAGAPLVGRTLWLSSHLPVVAVPAMPDIVVSPSNVAAALERLGHMHEAERRELEAEGVPYPHVDLPVPAEDAAAAVIDGPAPDGRGLRVISSAAEPGRSGPAEELRRLLAGGAAGGEVWLCCRPGEEATLRRLALENNLDLDSGARLVPARLRGHWELPDLRLRLVDASQILRRRMAQRAAGRLRGLDLGDIHPGEFVVHADYGIGRFVGLERVTVDGMPIDVVRLSYRGDDTVLVPVTRLDRLEPYRSGGDDDPDLDKLGSGAWQKRRSAAKAELVRFAADLLRLYADREQAGRPPLPPPGPLLAAVESSFPWEETADQLRALADVEGDLAAEHPMDRLLVGDVGFGKTEIALRTAIRFVEAGRQAAVLVPTTVLAAQHGRTFHERLKDLPVRIGVLSRFTPAAEERRILADMRSGRIDIVIGTHRLLQPDIVFERLGVLVVDEEHRFGVKHKEALKSLRRELDCLSMSATPIPRTLQMALGGLRPMSIIATPPANRLGVDTQVMPYDDDVIREALLRERGRGGQAFILRNRIEELEDTAAHLVSLVPDLRVGLVHGRMRATEIEDVFLRFLEHRIDALVATTIIESGLDFPRANTLIVLDAHRYGLAEMYQLRGRVGRSDRRAFAYLLHPPLERRPQQKAVERLEVLRSFSALGAGFHIAMRDLEIRGAGEVLGRKQAGQLKAVGLSTAMRLLEEAIHEAQGQPPALGIDPEITGDLPLVLSEAWIEDPVDRLRAYQTLSRLEDDEEAERRIAGLVDRFGAPTADDLPFLAAARLQPILRFLHVRQARFAAERCTLQLEPTTPLDPGRLLPWVQANPDVRLAPDRLVVTIPPHGPERAALLATTLRRMVRETLDGAGLG
jgi:transcription-repair coupling factor (superfamily II helicase)